MRIIPDLSRMKDVTDKQADEAAQALRRRLLIKRGDAVKLRRVKYLWDKRIPLGALTFIPGEEGVGKTTVGVRLMADLTNGKLEGSSSDGLAAPCCSRPRTVWPT